uniref:Uncharacterized protein n=1 Tax=Homalodisca liturata TaxID=320908 RepID=A0A1B6JJQ4_9HEMI
MILFNSTLQLSNLENQHSDFNQRQIQIYCGIWPTPERITSSEPKVKKKEMKAKERIDNALLKKTGLEIALVPEHEDDIKLASLLNMKPTKTAAENQQIIRKKISMLPSTPKTLTKAALGISRTSTAATSLVADYNSSEEELS